ncbi:hypothetical protein B4140_0717 [Bacillus amyloliquefaciens]|nr:hypothetical protein B4140_0717 [Bacillus amyloliquefaciens]
MSDTSEKPLFHLLYRNGGSDQDFPKIKSDPADTPDRF